MLIYNKKSVIILFSLIIIVISFIVIYQLFNNKFSNKIAYLEEEQQVLVEQLNNKLVKSNKYLTVIKEENKNLQLLNQALEQKIKELQLLKEDTEYKIIALNDKNIELEQSYNNLIKDKSDLEALHKELQLQIKNHKDNTYSLFQAGKLEVELSSVEQQLSEQYDNIAKKKNNLSYLKNKCGTLRINSVFCKEYDITLENIVMLEQQTEHLKIKREDLKQRINAYLASAK
jgi:chromosome segregation ATPase